ncbi:MAG: carbon monoxide dehydrogenase subunit G [Acetobacteraceae bacterium]|nr:carbon monoxide dehydrogenase subunit G [Acetobacteraceae bacterium]
MDMTGERRIPAPREKVWHSLNDPQVLKTCIPGCERLERTAENEYTATAAVKIGPIAARFNGKVNLLDLDEPNGYRIEGEGQGGVAGFAKGGATVRLAEDGPYTLLSYAVQAQVGGKIAQLGARLIDASSKQMADQFFNRFTNEVAGPPEVLAEGSSGVIAAATGDAPGAAPSPDAAAAHAEAAHKVRVGTPQGVPQPAPNAIRMLDLLPAEPFGLPWVAWIGIAFFIIIFYLLISAYL